MSSIIDKREGILILIKNAGEWMSQVEKLPGKGVAYKQALQRV